MAWDHSKIVLFLLIIMTGLAFGETQNREFNNSARTVDGVATYV